MELRKFVLLQNDSHNPEILLKVVLLILAPILLRNSCMNREESRAAHWLELVLPKSYTCFRKNVRAIAQLPPLVCGPVKKHLDLMVPKYFRAPLFSLQCRWKSTACNERLVTNNNSAQSLGKQTNISKQIFLKVKIIICMTFRNAQNPRDLVVICTVELPYTTSLHGTGESLLFLWPMSLHCDDLNGEDTRTSAQSSFTTQLRVQ